MTAVSQIIPNLLGGVSQQADPIKLPGQVRKAKNVLLDPTFGCKKRPATKFVKELETTLPHKVKWFNIFRDGNEKYVVAIFTKEENKDIAEIDITIAQEIEYTIPADKLRNKEGISLQLIDGDSVTDIASANVTIEDDASGNNYKITLVNLTPAAGNKVKIFQLITEPDIKIWDAKNGEPKHVDFTSKSRSYLVSENVDSIKPLTINDYTLLCNTERRVQMIDQRNTRIEKNPQVLVVLNTVSKDTEYGIDFIRPNEKVTQQTVTSVTKLTVANADRTIDHGETFDDVCGEKETKIFTADATSHPNSFDAGATGLKFQLKTDCDPGEESISVQGRKIPITFTDVTSTKRGNPDGYNGWWGRQAWFTKTIGYSDVQPSSLSTTQTFRRLSDNEPVQVTVTGRRRADYTIDGAKSTVHYTSGPVRGPNLQYNITFPFEKHEVYVEWKGVRVDNTNNKMWEFVPQNEAQESWDRAGEKNMTGRIRIKWDIQETAKLEFKRNARPVYVWDFGGAVRASKPEGEWKEGDEIVSELTFTSDSKRHSNGNNVYFANQKTKIYLKVGEPQTLPASPKNKYSSKYKTVVTLEEGGTGYAAGQKFSVIMQGRTYDLTIESTDTTTSEVLAGKVDLKLDATGAIKPDTEDQLNGNQASVTGVLTGLATEIKNNSALSNFKTQIIGNVLFVESSNGTEFNVRTRSGLGTNALVSIKNSVNDVSVLPTQCKEDFVLKVSNSADSESDDYFLKFVPSLAETDGQGVWEETTAPGIDLDLDPGTMPHALIRRADGTFIFQSLGEPDYSKEHTIVEGETEYAFKFPYVRTEDIKATISDSNGDNEEDFDAFTLTIKSGDEDNILTLKTTVAAGKKLKIYRDYSTDPLYWAPRAVGDDISNPVPSFVGQKINSLFFFSNRLGILSQDTVVMSQPSDYFNFFVGSAIAVSDSDPVDITASATKPATLKSALSTAKGLLLFAENSQFLVTSDDNVFGPATIKINEISNYGYQSSVDPVETGVSIMFSTESTTFTKVFELALDSIENRPVVSENTRIVPEYVPPNLKFVESNSNNSIVVFGDGTKEVSVFKFYNAANERNQAGWCKWEFPAPVRSFAFEQDTAYIVLHHGDSCILAHLNMLDDPDVSPIRSLDRQFTPRLDLYHYKEDLPKDSIDEDTDSSVHGMSKIILPAGSYVDGFKVTLAVTESEADTEFYEFDVKDKAGQKYISVKTEFAEANNFVLGLPYDMEIEFPAFYVLNDKKADRKNHPVVHTAYFDFYYSGRTEVVLKRKGYDDITSMGLEAIRADLYLADSAAMDEVTTNALSVYCRGDLANVTIKAHDPLPVSITSYRWEGSYNNRGVSII